MDINLEDIFIRNPLIFPYDISIMRCAYSKGKQIDIDDIIKRNLILEDDQAKLRMIFGSSTINMNMLLLLYAKLNKYEKQKKEINMYKTLYGSISLGSKMVSGSGSGSGTKSGTGTGTGLVTKSLPPTSKTPFIFSPPPKIPSFVPKTIFKIRPSYTTPAYLSSLETFVDTNALPHYFKDAAINVPMIISFDNKLNEKSQNFINGLEHYDYNYIICGVNELSDDATVRMREYIKILEQAPPEQLVIISHAYDVLINTDKATLIANYNKLINQYGDPAGEKIIFGTEVGFVETMSDYLPEGVFLSSRKKDKTVPSLSSPIPDLAKLKKWESKFSQMYVDNKIKYKLTTPNTYLLVNLNFGVFGGKVKNILKMLKMFNIQPKENEQHLASEYFFTFENEVILDYEQTLFSNTAYKNVGGSCLTNTNATKYYNGGLDTKSKYNIITKPNIDRFKKNAKYEYDNVTKSLQFSYDNSRTKIITHPSFIHTPDNDLNCYNSIIDEIEFCKSNACYYYDTLSNKMVKK